MWFPSLKRQAALKLLNSGYEELGGRGNWRMASWMQPSMLHTPKLGIYIAECYIS
jgi:hypothetical protein